jgi:hypothetical protein
MGMSIADSGRRVRVLLGDLALLHDAGSLNLSGLSDPNIQLIVGNDRGGGHHTRPASRAGCGRIGTAQAQPGQPEEQRFGDTKNQILSHQK